jgi:ankyrin repeat protein
VYDITPLHYATSEGRKGTAQELIRLGAKIDAVDQQGWTPLRDAAR